MALTNRNEAYDITLFESTAKPLKKEKVNTDKNKKDNVLNIPKEKFLSKSNARRRLVNSIKAVSVGVVVTVFVGVIIQGQVQLTELNQKISNATTTLSEQESLYTQMQMKVDSKLSSTTVEDYAKTQLGMSRADSYQKEYISLSQEDKAEVAQSDSSNVFESIANAIAGLWS